MCYLLHISGHPSRPAQGLLALRRAAALLTLSLPTLTGCDISVNKAVIAPMPAASSAPVPSPFVPSVLISLAQAGGRHQFQLAGLSPETLNELTKLPPDDEAWHTRFAVYAGQKIGEGQLPMLGDFRVDRDMVIFEPRYPLRKGSTYTAVCRLPIGEGLATLVSYVTQEFTLPAPPETPLAKVAAVFPSSNELPENQLKFYFQFSAPMSRGEAYQRVHLLKASGEEVEFPFLELGEELWDDTGTRFTLFFDPGRIKRGLKPREEVGPSLVEGESYVLLIDKEWLDAEGRPLAEGFRKEFKAVAPDDSQPAVDKWQLTIPKVGTREPLVVKFNESLDQAMLSRVLAVSFEGDFVAGKIHIDKMETHWSFTPGYNWTAGKYELTIDSALEDLAGNSLAKPFEVDVFNKVDKSVETETVKLPFEIAE